MDGEDETLKSISFFNISEQTYSKRRCVGGGVFSSEGDDPREILISFEQGSEEDNSTCIPIQETSQSCSFGRMREVDQCPPTESERKDVQDSLKACGKELDARDISFDHEGDTKYPHEAKHTGPGVSVLCIDRPRKSCLQSQHSEDLNVKKCAIVKTADKGTPDKGRGRETGRKQEHWKEETAKRKPTAENVTTSEPVCPQKATLTGNDELCAECPIVKPMPVPPEYEQLSEWKQKPIQHGGHAAVEAVYRSVRTLNRVHNEGIQYAHACWGVNVDDGMLSAKGAFKGTTNVHLSPGSSLGRDFQVYLTPCMETFKRNNAVSRLPEDNGRLGRQQDACALTESIEFVIDLLKEGSGQVNVSAVIREGLAEALKICSKASDGSCLPKVYQKLQADKLVCVLSMYFGCEKLQSVVCLKEEDTRAVANQWLKENKQALPRGFPQKVVWMSCSLQGVAAEQTIGVVHLKILAKPAPPSEKKSPEPQKQATASPICPLNVHLPIAQLPAPLVQGPAVQDGTLGRVDGHCSKQDSVHDGYSDLAGHLSQESCTYVSVEEALDSLEKRTAHSSARYVPTTSNSHLASHQIQPSVCHQLMPNSLDPLFDGLNYRMAHMGRVVGHCSQQDSVQGEYPDLAGHLSQDFESCAYVSVEEALDSMEKRTARSCAARMKTPSPTYRQPWEDLLNYTASSTANTWATFWNENIHPVLPGALETQPFPNETFYSYMRRY